MYEELVEMLRVCGDSNNSCGDCPIRENDGSCPHGEWEFAAEKYMLEAADAIEEYLSHLQNAINWTVVEKDGLPSVPGEYLVYVRAGTDFKKPDTELDFDLNEVLDYVTTAYFDTDTCLWKENDEYYNGNLACVNKENTYYISHWADKPKPPKEDKPYGN